MGNSLDVLIEALGQILESLLLPLMARFVAEGSHFAAGLAFILIGLAVVVGLLFFLRLLPTRISLWQRTWRIKNILRPATSAEERRHLFAQNYADVIDPVMAEGFDTPSSRFFRRVLSTIGDEVPLQLAWSEIKETIIDETNERAIGNTARPHGYLMRVVPKPQRFANFAGLFVSFGLLLTFIGIISVLLKAGCDLRDGEISQYGICTDYLVEVRRVETQLGNQPDELSIPPSETPSSLANTEGIVLSIVGGAASKFYASIGGLAASIILRLLLEVYSFSLRRGVEELADVIERGLAYRPEQQFALDQLKEAQEQTTQLKMFNTDFAVTMGEKLGAAVQPMTERLTSIQDTLAKQATDTADALKEGVGTAINTMAGGEIREFGRVLGDLREELAGLSGKLSEGGDAAAQKMSDAAVSLEAIAQRLGEELQKTAQQVTSSGNEMNNTLTATAQEMRAAVTQLVSGLGEAREENAAAARQMGQELQGTVDRLTALIDEQMAAALEHASTQTAQAAQAAGSELKKAFKDASETWMAAVDHATTKIEALANNLDRNVQAVGRHAQAVDTAATSAAQAGEAIGQSASDLRNAADPIRQAAENIRASADSIANTVTGLGESTTAALTEISDLANKMSATAAAAEQAWSNYQTRFGQVDEQLARALGELTKALESNATRMQQHVSQIDSELANAVTRLSGAVQPLTDFTDELEQVIRKLQQAIRSRDARSQR